MDKNFFQMHISINSLSTQKLAHELKTRRLYFILSNLSVHGRFRLCKVRSLWILFFPDALIQKSSLLFISEILKYARYRKFLSSSVLWLLPSDNQNRSSGVRRQANSFENFYERSDHPSILVLFFTIRLPKALKMGFTVGVLALLTTPNFFRRSL